jgi:hypothetical protein
LDEHQSEKSYPHIKSRCIVAEIICLVFLICWGCLQDGDKFWRLPETYIRGNTIKYLCIPDEVIDMVPEETPQQQPAPGGRKHLHPLTVHAYITQTQRGGPQKNTYNAYFENSKKR